MIDYFRDGMLEESLNTTNIKKASKTKEALFYFFYIITFNCVCHPLLYCLMTIWESLQSAVLAMAMSETLGIMYEFKVKNTYIETILVKSLAAIVCKQIYSFFIHCCSMRYFGYCFFCFIDIREIIYFG